MGGLVSVSGKDLELQGNVFAECCFEEAEAFVEGKASYDRRPSAAKTMAAEVKKEVNVDVESSPNATRLLDVKAVK